MFGRAHHRHFLSGRSYAARCAEGFSVGFKVGSRKRAQSQRVTYKRISEITIRLCPCDGPISADIEKLLLCSDDFPAVGIAPCFVELGETGCRE